MFVKPTYPSYGGSTPEPDFASGAVLQTTGMDGPAFASQKARPIIPQKKKNIDELYRIRKELEDALRTKDEAVEMKDMMAMDLLSKEDELEEALKEIGTLKKQVEEQSIQLLEQKQRQSILAKGKAPTPPARESTAKMQAEHMQMRQQIEQLSAVLAEKDAQLSASAALAVNTDDQLQRSITETQMRLQSELQQKESEFQTRFAEEQSLRQTAEAELTRTKIQYETQLKATLALVEEEKKHTQASELALNEQMNRMNLDSTSQQQHEQIVASYEEKLRDQRQRCEQFRRTSERLTTQIKQGTEIQRGLERSDQEMRQRVEDMKSEIGMLRSKLRDYRMPGSFGEDRSSRYR